jgi:hypothetical protein
MERPKLQSLTGPQANHKPEHFARGLAFLVSLGVRGCVEPKCME